MVRNAIGAACGLVMACGAVAGCGTAQREAGPWNAAEEFLSALDRGDTAAACSSLAPEALEDLTASQGRPCEEALGTLAVPIGPVQETAVWGDRAQVRTDADVLFLTEFATAWRIAAAGCRSQGDRPYECEVGG